MFLRNKYYTSSNKKQWFVPVFWSIYCLLIAILFKEFKFKLSIPISIITILGTAISLFLSFRTNSAYERWWEARKIWGAIVNDSRTFSRQAICFGDIKDASSRYKMVNRQIAWNWLLSYRLRGLGWAKEAEPYLDKKEIEILKLKDNAPNYLLLVQEKELKQFDANNELDDFDFRQMDETLKRLCDSMGKCERIKTTIFPTQYSLFTSIFIYLFLFLLPFGLVESIGYYSIGIHVAIGYTFAMIQDIAKSMQNPFENKPNDTSVFAISRTIERNLLEMIGENDLPEVWKSENGVLM